MQFLIVVRIGETDGLSGVISNEIVCFVLSLFEVGDLKNQWGKSSSTEEDIENIRCCVDGSRGRCISCKTQSRREFFPAANLEDARALRGISPELGLLREGNSVVAKTTRKLDVLTG